MVGIPGCGKSLVAKTMSSSWQMPLLKLDIGKVFQGLVGASESNIRNALNTAATISPCILWIDEIEKSLSSSSGSTDGGTTSRVFGTILTWMQENTSPVFVYATANDISRMPPELLRKGRFDEIFFVDLPGTKEREEIFSIHIQKVGLSVDQFDLTLLAKHAGPSLLGESISLTGAEIESVIQNALISVFSKDDEPSSSTKIITSDIISQIKNIVPLAKLRNSEFTKLREWADENAVSAYKLPSSTKDSEVSHKGGRNLDI